MSKPAIRAGLAAVALLTVGTTVVACRADDGREDARSERTRAASRPAAGPESDTDADREDDRETERQAGEIDEALAERGEDAFRSRGCIACHTVGDGRLVGPDLAGVTGRRERGWILAMIQNPDSMLKNDPEARALLAQYGSPMTNLGVTADEAAAIYEYLREETEEHDAEASALAPPAQDAGAGRASVMRHHHRAMHGRTPEGTPPGTEPFEPTRG